MVPNSQRIFYIRYAIKAGMDIDTIYQLTGIDPWFLNQIVQIIKMEDTLAAVNGIPDAELLRRAKEMGFSDIQLAHLSGIDDDRIRGRAPAPEHRAGLQTCRYPARRNSRPIRRIITHPTKPKTRCVFSDRKKVIILGGGPNRIGQGIEFDYCCVQASFALREEGIESIMVNSNPETVSTDYDTSDKLYFEPLTKEDVLNIIETEKPLGVIVQFGGQTPLNLTESLAKAGAPILGTSPHSIAVAEDRELFRAVLKKLGLKQPENNTAMSVEEATAVAAQIGYPVMVRPSYVLGGRAMQIAYDEPSLEEFTRIAKAASPRSSDPDR